MARIFTVPTDLLDAEAGAIAALCASAGVDHDATYIGQVVHETLREQGESGTMSPLALAQQVLPRLDLNCRQVELAAGPLTELLRADAHVLLQAEEGAMLLVRGQRGQPEKLDVDRGAFVPLTRRDLRRIFKSAPAVAALVVDPPQMIRGLSHSSASPLVRIFRVLRAERTDIGIVVLFAFVSGLLMLATPLAIESLVNTIAFGRFLQPVIVLALLLLGFLVFLAGIRILQTIVVEIFQRRMFARIAADFSYRIPRIDADFEAEHDVPDVVNYFMEVPTLQKTFAQLLLDGVTLVLSALIGLAVLAFYHPWLLGFDILLLLLVSAIIFSLGYGAFNSSIKESKKKYGVFGWLQSLGNRFEILAIPGARQLAASRASHLIDGYLEARRQHFAILLRQIVASLLLQAVASTALLGLGGWLVISGELTLGQLIAAELIVTAVLSSFAKLGKHMESFYDLVASVEKIGHVLDLPLETATGTLTLDSSAPMAVSLQNVRHAASGGLPGLEPQTREIASGAHIAILAPPGSQAEVLMNLLAGRTPPGSGRMLLDEINIREIRRQSLLDDVVLVREVSALPGTISENVHLNRPDTSPMEVYRILNSLGTTDDFESLPDGLNTQLQPRGYPLNARQRVLLSIARAMAAKPRLLLIDGLLDTLDAETGIDVLQMLCGPEHPWTLVVRTARREFADCCSDRWDLGMMGRSNDAPSASPS